MVSSKSQELEMGVLKLKAEELLDAPKLRV